MIRFFAASADIQGDTVTLSQDDSAHLHSLRVSPFELFTVCDGEGFDYVCKLGEKSSGTIAHIVEKRASCGEPTVRCHVYIALAKGDRLDYAVQKSVELGAFEIVLFHCARCIATLSNMPKKIARLQRIALETAKQCGRGRVPSVCVAESFKVAAEQAAFAELPLFFYEDEKELSLKAALERGPVKAISDSGGNTLGSNKSSGDTSGSNISDSNKPGDKTAGFCTSRYKSISILTGPEGGFEPYEAEIAREAGLISVSLGPRILRCETAPIAALSVIMFTQNELEARQSQTGSDCQL